MSQPQKMVVLVKVSNTKFVKYRVQKNGFQSFYKFLDKDFPDWRFGNVYFQRKQIGSFTKNNRVQSFSPNH